MRELRSSIQAAAIAALAAGACRAGSTPERLGSSIVRADATVANIITGLERTRVAALLAADTVVAGPLHAADFQLVTPSGSVLGRQRYLGGIASKRLRYLAWAPESIVVRSYGDAAVIRYKSHMVMIVAGTDTVKPFGHWHTDLYEKRSGRWQAVWSQATAIQ